MHRVAISQSFRLRKDSIFFSLLFFSLVPPFFYTIVVRTGSSKRGEKKRMTESIIRFGGEKERKIGHRCGVVS